MNSALDELLDGIKNQVALLRRDLHARSSGIDSALAAYVRAVEERAAYEYAVAHSLARPSLGPLTPAEAAQKLLSLVAKLPELRPASQESCAATSESCAATSEPGAASSEPGAAARSPSVGRAQPSASKTEASSEGARPLAAVLPSLAERCLAQRLLLVGAFAGRRPQLPESLAVSTEIVDTSRGSRTGAAVLPNLRSGAYFALLLCDKLIAHSHAEPLLAAARSKGLAVGFGGKGGSAGLAAGLRSIESQLALQQLKK